MANIALQFIERQFRKLTSKEWVQNAISNVVLWLAVISLVVYITAAEGMSGYVLGFAVVIGFAYFAEDFMAGRIVKRGATKFRLVVLRLMKSAKRTALWMLLLLAPYTLAQVYLNQRNDTEFANALENTSLWINERTLDIVNSGAPLYFVIGCFVCSLVTDAFKSTQVVRRVGTNFFRTLTFVLFATSFTFLGTSAGVSIAQKWLLTARDSKEIAAETIRRASRESAFAQMVTTESAGTAAVVRYVTSSIVAGSTFVTTREAIRNYFVTELAEMGHRELTTKQLLLTQTDDMRLGSLVEVFTPPYEPAAIRVQLAEWKAAETVAIAQSRSIRGSLAAAVETALGTALPSIPNSVIQAYVDEFLGATSEVFVDLTPSIDRKFLAATALSGQLNLADVPESALARRLATPAFYEAMVPVVAKDLAHLQIEIPNVRVAPGTIFRDTADVAAKHAPPPNLMTRIFKAIF